jgi:eukaryotic-like serine/threonine-protein kinase
MGVTAYDADRPHYTPGPQEAADPLIGRRIDHFEIRHLLGEGGMGSVYLAHDLSRERPVAIKVLRREFAKNDDLVGRLVLEARAQARLQHHNVVTIYYIGAHEGAPYFAMEYVRGRTLAEYLAERGPLPWGEALEYIIQTTHALMAAHAKGIVHRDIKPSNLILNGEVSLGAPLPEIRVADFGLAVPLGSAEEAFVGSPFYAAPEQMTGARRPIAATCTRWRSPSTSC